MITKLARIELEVTHPDNCPYARVWRDYTTHDLSRIDCMYPYVRTCIPSGVKSLDSIVCKWFTGNSNKCPLNDVTS